MAKLTNVLADVKLNDIEFAIGDIIAAIVFLVPMAYFSISHSASWTQVCFYAWFTIAMLYFSMSILYWRKRLKICRDMLMSDGTKE
jgi:hypothetical protein